MILTLIKIGLLMVSYLGYWECFRKKLDIDVHFVPAFTLSIQFLVMFIPGLLNFLEETVILIYLLGVVLLLRAFAKDKIHFLRKYITPGYAIFAIMFAMSAVFLRGAKLENIDNFHHWGTVVCNMLKSDRFPTFAQKNVSFGHYPLGSSALIYYFCRFTAPEEDMMMLAQAFIMLCMFLSVFSYIKKNWVMTTVIETVMLNFLLSYNIPLADLRVDTILPIVSCAMILFWHHECFQKQELKLFDSRSRMYLAFPMMFLTMNIKTAGILFVAMLLWLAVVEQHKVGKEMKPMLYMGMLLVMGYFLWDRHVDYVFMDADSGSHTISFFHFSRTLKGKNLEDIGVTIWQSCVFALKRKELIYVCSGVITAGILTLACGKSIKNHFGRLFLWMTSFRMVYFFSLVCMYIFSMENEAASELASIGRYIKIADIIVYVLLMVYNIEMIASMERKWMIMTSNFLLLMLMLGIWNNSNGMTTVFEMKNDMTRRHKVEMLLEEYGVASGWSYLMCDTKYEGYYSTTVARYYLDSPDVSFIDVTDKRQLDEQEGYQYIIIMDEENAYVQDWVEENYPEQAGKRVIQCFG